MIQETVEFQRLGLAIIDEQHKFGVIQRALLRKKGRHPHIVVIPRPPFHARWR
jgi:ATP-dependent DNA helicase RecG